VIDFGNGAMEKKKVEDIQLSAFDNDEGWGVSQWDVVTGGINYAGGSVGIGTTTPTSALHLGVTGNDAAGGGTGGIKISRATDATLGFMIRLSASDKDLNIDYQDDSDVWGTAMTFDRSSGYVGIGTTIPESLLHVKAEEVTGVVKIEGGKAVVIAVGEINAQLEFGSNDGSCQDPNQVCGKITSVTESINGANVGMGFYTYDQTYGAAGLIERVRINNEGNVGINTILPVYKLDVNGTVGVSDNMTLSGGAQALIIKAGATDDRVFMEWYADSDNQATRTGWTGFGQVAGVDYSVKNEMTGGEILLITDGVTKLATTATGIAVTSAITATGEITSYSSDGRLKTNVNPIENPLDILDKINGVTFMWRDGVEELGFKPSRQKEHGFIAQNIQTNFPEGVAPAPFDRDGKGESISGDDYLTVKPEKLIPLLVEGIKELRRELDSIKSLTAKY